jgi:methyl-accepting chemotaxis protein
MTQQNAALVEEAAAAAESLQDQAGSLSDSVSVFNVGHSRSRTVSATPALSARPAPRLPAPVRPVAGRQKVLPKAASESGFNDEF